MHMLLVVAATKVGVLARALVGGDVVERCLIARLDGCGGCSTEVTS
jgi:hypothetical protein